MSNTGIKSVIADLKAMRYRTSDIAREIGCTRQYVNKILRDLGMNERRLRALDELPMDLQDRVRNVRMFPQET